MTLPKIGLSIGAWHIWMAFCIYTAFAIPAGLLGFVMAILGDDGRLAGATAVVFGAGIICGFIAAAWSEGGSNPPRKPPPPARLGRAGRKQVRRVRRAERVINSEALRERADLMLTQRVTPVEELPPPLIHNPRDYDCVRWREVPEHSDDARCPACRGDADV